ncbi:MAG TPA: hypothetical protein VF897_19960 [Roseiflexaceae bacterium]
MSRDLVWIVISPAALFFLFRFLRSASAKNEKEKSGGILLPQADGYVIDIEARWPRSPRSRFRLLQQRPRVTGTACPDRKGPQPSKNGQRHMHSCPSTLCLAQSAANFYIKLKQFTMILLTFSHQHDNITT